MGRDEIILPGHQGKIRWQNPPSESAAGQVVKTPGGDLVVYVGELMGIDSKFRVLLHEIAHCRHDADWIPTSHDYRLPAASIKRSDAERQSWRASWHIQRVTRQAEIWMQYTEQNAFKYYRAGRDVMTCKLLALMNWSE